MSDEQRKEYDLAARQRSVQPTEFFKGCKYAHYIAFPEGEKKGKKEGWNEAIEVCAKIAWQYRHQIGSLSATLNDELQKLRK